MAEAQRLLCAAHRRLHVRDIAPCDLHDDCENRHGVFWRHVVLEKHPCQGDAEAVLLGRGPRACYHDGHGRVLGEFNWSSQHLDDEVLRCRNGNGEGQTGRVGLRCVRLVGRR